MIHSFDIYEIRSPHTSLHGMKLRGRIRKFCIENHLSCLVENASDEENVVRFAIPTDTDHRKVESFIHVLVPETSVSKVLDNVSNPVLSKLKVNDASWYEI